MSEAHLMSGSGKLLAINNFHYRRAGSDAAFLDHDRLFRARGWQTAVFSMQHPDNLDSPWKHFFVREIELARRHPPFARLRMAAKVLYSREARAQLARLLDVFKPDVAHVHSVYHHISPAILPMLDELGVPVVLTAHDYKLACPAYKMFDGRAICEDCRGGRVSPLLSKRCLHGSGAISALVAIESTLHRWLGSYERHVDRIVCPSRFLLEKLAEWGWPRERLVHIPNFFDAGLWVPRFEPGRYVLYFGRWAPEKGLHTLVRACALAHCPVKMVGWGTEGEMLRKLAREVGAEIEFVERVPAAALAEIIRGARCVVLPSEWYENASLAILESFACGKPVLASRIGGNPELIRAGENGWLFEPGNVLELAERLSQVACMPARALEKLGRAAHAWVSEQFNAERYYEATASLYSGLGAQSHEARRAARSPRHGSALLKGAASEASQA